MPNADTANMPSTEVASFVKHLESSKRILAVLGAGISASSGLPTFRGKGGYWRTHDATMLATPEAFRADPALVWQFYSYRRHMALNAKPNGAHLALAELARRKPEFITLSQNVDGLSPRADHPADQLKLLHGNLFDVKCWDRRCGYVRHNDFTDPIAPALALPEDPATAIDKAKKEGDDSSAVDAHVQKHPLLKGADISNISVPIPSIPLHDLPQCPKCQKNLLRPGVVWFGESLPLAVIDSVQEYFEDREPIDLMLVIGTSSKVYPAAGLRRYGAREGR